MEAKPFPTLAGKVAIVTGASRGIGVGLALELARRGAKVAITYTSESSTPKAEEIIQKIQALNTDPGSPSAIRVKADLCDPSSPQQIIQEALHGLKTTHIDILINNAAMGPVIPLSDITPEDFSATYDLNVRAPLLMTQAVLPYLRSPGRIINISSVGGRCGFKNLALYCSSKAALEGLTRCLAAELGEAGHTVNTVNPGPVQTEMLDDMPRDIVEMQKAQTPMQNRIGTVDDVAQIVAWLASEESRWVTGQALSASGGWAMY